MPCLFPSRVNREIGIVLSNLLPLYTLNFGRGLCERSAFHVHVLS